MFTHISYPTVHILLYCCLAHGALVVAQHGTGLNLISEQAELFGTEHGFDERKDALCCGEGARQGERNARGFAPGRERGAVVPTYSSSSDNAIRNFRQLHLRPGCTQISRALRATCLSPNFEKHCAKLWHRARGARHTRLTVIIIRTGRNDNDERHIDGHTAVHPAPASELCAHGSVGCGREKSPGWGFRASVGHARVP